MNIFKNNDKKYIVSKNYNCIVDKKTNFFIRCGNTISEVPSAGALEYIDMELTSIYSKNYEHSYKTSFDINREIYMTFKFFRRIINKLPDSLNHINFLVDPKCETNPDIWKILYYCKRINITTSMIVDNINFKTARKISKYCKSVSVNLHENKNICYNTIERFTDNGIQTNLNILVSKETHHLIIGSLYDFEYDPRLKNLNLFYFIGLKQQANWRFYNKIELVDFKKIIDHVTKKKIPFGFDNSLTPYFIDKVSNEIKCYHNLFNNQCESFTFYVFIDVIGWIFPCKYYTPDPQNMIGFNIFHYDNFEDLWGEKYLGKIRKRFITKNKKGVRVCPLFQIY